MTGRMEFLGGVPIFIPNDVTISVNDFYISYNDRDVTLYGDVTTALVLNNPLKFLILNGNHSRAYDEIISMGGGYAECLEYFKANIDLKAKYSDNWYETLVFGEDGSIRIVRDV